MAKILIVDDNATNRKLLTALLNHEGHVTIEAVDGADGLASARAERPHLVISDILMPTMDGYEFVRQLRADPQIGNTPVIFHTAHYHEFAARRLAQTCRVARVLAKPSSVTEIHDAVQQALAIIPTPATDVITEEFDREHLRLLSDKLSKHAAELSAANARLAALTELNVQLASERDPSVLLERVCHGARNLLGSKYAVLAVGEKEYGDALIFSTSGIDFGGAPAERPRIDAGALGKVVAERRSWRMLNSEGRPVDTGLPGSYPPASAVLAVPLSSLTHTYGWLCLADKIGADGFSAEDDRLLSILGAQVGRIYENGKLFREVQLHSAQLLVEMDKREHALTELRESEERFRQLAETIDDVFFVLAADYSRTLYLSPAYERIWGRPCISVYENPMAWSDAIHPEDKERIRILTQRNTGGVPTNDVFEYRIVRPDGAIRWILTRTFQIPGQNGSVGRLVGVATDITDRKQAQAKIEKLNRVHAMLSGINSLIVRVHGRDELFKEACRLAVEHGRFRIAWCGRYDADAGEVTPIAWAGDSPDLAQRVRPVIAPVSADDTLIATALRSQQPAVCNELDDATTGVLYAQEMVERGYHAKVVLPLVIAGKSIGCLVLVTGERDFFDDEEMRLLIELAGDISFALDHIHKAETLNYLAYYDALTGLANRTFFHERLAQHISAAGRGTTKLALVIVDPERFDSINDTFGRLAGDQLLRQMAARFVGCVGDQNEVGRIGADHFAAVIADVKDEADVARTIEGWWKQWLDTPFHVDGHEARISAKAGIAIYPDDGGDADTLLKHAEAALKNAKLTGDPHLFYTRQLSERISEKIALEIRLRHGLQHEEFVLHYQPKVDLETRQLTGVEALIRWQSPELGLVPPAKFIPLMEETGMIAQAGAWALRQACLDRSRWFEQGLSAPRVAVNVSTVQLRREDFVRTVSNILEQAGRETGIDIEVTESLLMDNVADAIEKLTTIRDLGVNIAIDDFGTGYSSLGYLAKLPVKTLKIDRSFVSVMLDDPSAMTLISMIISLAHSLKLEVVAEGVESEEQAKILRLLRCDQMQGYLISKPLSFEDMTARMEG